MKPEIAKIWCEALRSGKYKQGQNCLCQNNKYCCLGVLCELAHKNEISIKKETSKGLVSDMIYYDSAGGGLPTSVQDWSGVKTPYGQYGEFYLSEMNDNGMPFTEIADFIEKNVENL